MQRRTLLRRTAALGTIGLAGCTSSGNDDGGNGNGRNGNGGNGNGGNGNGDGVDNGDGGTPTDTPTATPTPDGPPGVEDSSIETTDTSCESGEGNTASVEFDSEGDAITVDGVIGAPNPCHVASVEGVEYGPDGDAVEVTIVAESDDSDDLCEQCLGAIGYEASVTFDGEPPGAVVVYHGTGEDQIEVVRAARDGGE